MAHGIFNEAFERSRYYVHIFTQNYTKLTLFILDNSNSPKMFLDQLDAQQGMSLFFAQCYEGTEVRRDILFRNKLHAIGYINVYNLLYITATHLSYIKSVLKWRKKWIGIRISVQITFGICWVFVRAIS